jgi:patatin-like phospholipase/acyl hydrolase
MSAKESVRILCLDGGGFKGLSSLVILKELMAQISGQYGNTLKLRPCDYFDLICGTGTGGLIAIILERLQLVRLSK